MSAQDRIFAAANDNDTLAGQLAAQARQFDRERLDEVKAGGEAMTDLLSAQQAEELALRKSFADKAIEETKRAQEALNGTAKNVVDYLNGLTSGPQSTLAPTAVLSNAQSAYNNNLALALGGNADAQAKFVSLADNLEKAARAVYASGQGYQDIRNQIINQGLALPAVQQTTDPVVQSLANVLAAIQAGNATQALDATLQNVIKSAIDAGNATAIAALLLPTMGSQLTFQQYLNGLGPLAKDPTVQGLLTDAQLRAQTLGVTGPLTQAQIQGLGLSTEQGNILNVFRELDNNGNGIIEKAEATAVATGQSRLYLTDIDKINATQWGIDVSSNAVLQAIQGLQATGNSTLQTLRDAFVASALTFSAGAVATPPPTSNSDPVITALRKIVYNTGITAANVYSLGGKFGWPTFAQGGWITGGIQGRDSVPIMAMPDEFMVRADATRALTSAFGPASWIRSIRVVCRRMSFHSLRLRCRVLAGRVTIARCSRKSVRCVPKSPRSAKRTASTP
jgi:hypothetical protein